MMMIASIVLAALLSPVHSTTAAQEKSSAATTPAPPVFLALDHVIALAGVRGRIDHLALDSKRGLLYVAALENATVEIVDLRARAKKSSLAGMSEPQGVLFLDGFDVVL